VRQESIIEIIVKVILEWYNTQNWKLWRKLCLFENIFYVVEKVVAEAIDK